MIFKLRKLIYKIYICGKKRAGTVKCRPNCNRDGEEVVRILPRNHIILATASIPFIPE